MGKLQELVDFLVERHDASTPGPLDPTFSASLRAQLHEAQDQLIRMQDQLDALAAARCNVQFDHLSARLQSVRGR